MPVLRWLAISIAAIAILETLYLVFQPWHRVGTALRLSLPYAVAAVIPYLIAYAKLSGNPASMFGLATAVVVPAAIILAIAWAGWAFFFKVSPLAAILAAPIYAVFGAFCVTQVLLIRAVAMQAMAHHMLGRLMLSCLFALLIYGAAAAIVVPGLVKSMEGTWRSVAYTETSPKAFMARLFRGLWQAAGPGAVHGFPPAGTDLRTLGPEAWDAKYAPGGEAYGTHYDFRYAPTPGGFVLSTNARRAKRAFTDSWSIDHLGVVRRSVTGWVTPHDRVESFGPIPLGRFIGMLEAFRDVHAAWPSRFVIGDRVDRIGTDMMPIPSYGYISPRAIEPLEDGATRIVLELEGRAITYRPEPGGYTASYRAGGRDIYDLRSYFADRDGAVHFTPEDREATDADPLVEEGEWTKARAEGREWALKFIGQVRNS